ncbi:DUF1471 domain-containing protein [Kluyvera genomosp. 1]|uniref:DUF1471 domain-containing protein n=1 Tax=Kluyvera genomosp. 1 TaxID=2774053 RepID=UPI00068F059E|nr:DUF1471 domain-containing protein [Kluyvera genomosp. 1]
MNTRHLLYLATILATFPFSAHASPIPTGAPTGQFRPVGTVSASGAANLDDLQQQLAKKAHQAGAKAYVVDAASGKNKMFGSATLYE